MTILSAAALLLSGENDARACSQPINFPFSIDAEEVAVDDSPPAEIPAIDVGEVEESREIGCSDCGDGMFLQIEITPPADDRTAPGDIGYEVELVDGEFPFFVADGLVRGPTLSFFSSERHRVFTATLEIRPVDRAGNVGPASRVVVRNGVAGCNMSLGSCGGAAWLAIAALHLLARRRRLTAPAA